MIGATRTAALHVDIDADTKGVSSGVDEASGKFSKLGGAAKLGGLAIAGGLVIGAKAAVDMIGKASDLNETISKSRVIFGKHADEMETWAKGAATSMGLSEDAALSAASQFGDMFRQIGFTGDQATSFSKKTVQMATDLASFNNLPTADVLDSLSGAFRGEYDSLQRVIPNISAARVQQEALNETHKKSVDDLTAAEKATATLAIVQQDASRASGDFARTSGGLANQQKILHAQLDNVQASIGQKLLPVAVAFAKFANDKLLPAAQDLGNWLEKHLGPAFSDIGHFIADDVVPAAQEFEHWFAEKIAPALKKDVAPIVKEVRSGFGDLGDSIHDNGPELRDLLHALGQVVEFIVKRVGPVLAFAEKEQFNALFTTISNGLDIIGALVDAFKQVAHWVDVATDALSHFHVPSIHLPSIPGLEAPSYAPGTPAGFGTAGWTGSSLGDLLGASGVALTSGVYVDRRDFSTTVQVDGSGIVDERAIVNQLTPLLARHAERLATTPLALLTP